jgi:UDP-N-acetylglucosamine:LPS N-acetylglucosamine transferase
MAEIAPAKSFIPILKKLDADIIGLTHGGGVDELLGGYCTEIHNIGKSRGKEAKKRSNAKIASLVLSDILSVVKSLSGKKIDLLMTCGNAGDVRKGIAASKFLRIPTFHIEQDIYNPIEMIAFSNLITVPSKHYADFITQNYGLKNVKVIGGYPMASYVNEIQLKDEDQIKNEFSVDDFLLLVFGGDIKGDEIPEIIKTVEKLEKDVLIAPFRFSSDYVRNIVKSEKLKVLDGFVDLLSLMKASSGVIYGAGMGITIEAGVLGVPALKLAGFHRKHASIDLARELGIPVVKIEEIPNVINDLKSPKGEWLVKNGEKAVSNVVSLVTDFENQKSKSSGFGSFRKIWNARSEFR